MAADQVLETRRLSIPKALLFIAGTLLLIIIYCSVLRQIA